MRPKKDLTQGPVFPHLLRMALPMMIGLTAHMLLNLVDGMYVSHLGTGEAMAVLNYGFPIFYVPFALFNGLSTGASAILAQYLGGKKKEEAGNVLAQTMAVALGAYFLLLLLFPVMMAGYLTWLNVPEVVGDLTRSYLNIAIVSLFFTCISLLLGSGLRAEGNMKVLMKAMMYGTLLNLVIDPFFIFGKFSLGSLPLRGLDWGVRGAAAATLLSAMLTFVIIARQYFKRNTEIAWPKMPTWENREGLFKVWTVGAPAMVSQMMLAFMTTAVTFLATPFGPHAIAAMGIGTRLDIIAVFPSLAITTAVISLVGQNFGGHKLERVRESIRVGLTTAFVSLLVIGGLVFVFKNALVGFFGPEPEVGASAVHYITCVSFSYAFSSLAMVAGGAFQGLGRGLPGMYITVLRLFVLNFSLGYILSRFTPVGEWGIHYAPMLANITMGVVGLVWLLRALRRLHDTPAPEASSV